MADEEKKKTALEIFNETLQYFLFGTIFFRKGGPTQAGGVPQEAELPKVPAWIVSKFHLLTTEDEQEYDQILDAFNTDPDQQSAFFAFKNRLVAEGYDEDHLRLMLVNLNRDYLNRKDAKKTEIPNSAIEFIRQIVLLDGDYPAQKKLAKEKHFLRKVTRSKRFFLWGREKKLKFLSVFVIYLPVALFIFLYWTLKLIIS